MTTATERRRPSARTAILAIGGIGLAGAMTYTMAQWTDEATVTGEITTGEFEILIDGGDTAAFNFDGEFLPDEPLTSTHTLTNGSTVDALVNLSFDGFDAPPGLWDLTVVVDGADPAAFEGDPSGGAAGVPLGPDGDALVLPEGGEATVDLTLTLVDDTDAGQGQSFTPTFTFNGTSDTAPDPEG